jgi:hypothetical protein
MHGETTQSATFVAHLRLSNLSMPQAIRVGGRSLPQVLVAVEAAISVGSCEITVLLSQSVSLHPFFTYRGTFLPGR